MKKINLISSIALALLVVFCMSFVGCGWMEEKEARSRIKGAFKVEVPKQAKMVFNHYQSWQESVGYTVFIFEKEPTGWLNESEFLKEKDEKFENKTKEGVDRFFAFSNRTRGDGGGCTGKGVKDLSQKYVPDFEKEYWWKEHKRENEFDCVALLYVPEKRMLVYFVETW